MTDEPEEGCPLPATRCPQEVKTLQVVGWLVGSAPGHPQPPRASLAEPDRRSKDGKDHTE
jgi:hypothetical protein